jgi:hypothetical protein
MDLPATFSGRAKQQARLPGRNPALPSAKGKLQNMEEKENARRTKLSTTDVTPYQHLDASQRMGVTHHLHKGLIIDRIAKDGVPGPAVVHHMIDRARILNAERAGHPARLPRSSFNSQPKV